MGGETGPVAGMREHLAGRLGRPNTKRAAWGGPNDRRSGMDTKCCKCGGDTQTGNAPSAIKRVVAWTGHTGGLVGTVYCQACWYGWKRSV